MHGNASFGTKLKFIDYKIICGFHVAGNNMFVVAVYAFVSLESDLLHTISAGH